MLAIIPARSGSKGLPGKNIKSLLGKPMIAYTIEAALNSDYISKVIVSTDSEEIYNLSIQFGADKSFIRPDILATDQSLAVDTYIYTIDRIEELLNETFNDVVILQPTSPLRLTSDIDSAIELYITKKADSVIGFCMEDHPISWNRELNSNGSVLEFESKLPLKNRQDEKTTYYPNGAIYVLKKELLFKKSYYTDKTYAYIMPRKRSVDIDTLDDFELAEFYLERRKNETCS